MLRGRERRKSEGRCRSRRTGGGDDVEGKGGRQVMG